MRIFSYNPQDRVTTPPTTVAVRGAEPTAAGGVQTDRVTLVGTLEPKDGGYVYDPRNARRWVPACAFASVANTVDTFQGYLTKPLTWAFPGEQLGVVGNAGGGLNAFYSRNAGQVLFFTGNGVSTGASGEVTAHEAGHAILDALRPGYMKSFRPDVGAFHESFGDLMALYTTLLNPEVAARVDLHQDNLASRFGEELGIALGNTGGEWTRNARNSFVWQEPSTLPKEGPPDVLTADVHNLSRLWTGACYEVLTGMVDARRAAGESQVAALRGAADDSLKMWASLLQGGAPASDFTFADMARAWVASAGPHAGLITEVMTRRRILGGPSATEEAVVLEGRFAGCSVEGTGLGSIGKLIEEGRIRWTEPNEIVRDADLVDYVGVVRWTDGRPVIERTGVFA